MNNEDLCVLVYVVIYDMKDLFILCIVLFDCKIEKDCE